jgi:hypothetical protein
MEIMSAAGWRIKSGVSHSLSLVFSFEGDNPSIIAKLTASNFRLRGGGRSDKMIFLLERAEVAL